ncbi:MAG: iron ABC transporter permease [Deltaproteobacteria bacterium]|nr:iron ABC transporter permease [Deltaproteobacteria bacterium]
MNHKRLTYILIIASPFIAGFASLFLGAYDISPLDILSLCLHRLAPFLQNPDMTKQAVIMDIRLPRIILAGLVGIALSTTGVTLQGIFRNPLVDPFILGISAGAAFGCAVSVAFIPEAPIQITAFVFGCAAVFLAYFIGRTQGEVSRLPLILSGVIISAFFSALVSIVKFLVDPMKLQNIVFWLMGSFSLANWQVVKIVAVTLTISLVPVFLLRWRLNVISMGEDEAKSMGINVRRDRIIFITASTLAVSVAVSVSGIIGWVGLMVPHLIRMIAGPDHKSLVPLSMAGGAAFMIIADTIARNLTTFDLPVGIITAITGAPFFIYLLKRGGQESWGR